MAGRDGLIYAFEEKNSSGGVAGQKVELIVRDDKQDPVVARQAMQELVNEGVVAVVGPMTSSMGVVLKPVADKTETIIISPTVKTDQLSAQDDYFFRVTTPLSNNAEQIAFYATHKLGLQKFAVVYDVTNRAFTETWLNYFREALGQNKGQIVSAEEFVSRPDIHFLPIAERAIAESPDGVLLLCNAIDTAMLAQQLRKLGSQLPLFSTEWAFTTDLISFGGRAVNGMTSFHSFNANDSSRKYAVFKQGFMKRFGYEPSFATVLSYDAATYLFQGLERSPHRNGLRNALQEVGAFPGLQSTISMDKYGDVKRTLFLTTVDNGEFKVLE